MFKWKSKWIGFKAGLKDRSPGTFWILETVETLGVALVLALLIRHFILQVSLVPTGSMIPTLEIRDRLFVNKFIYDFTTPKRGDIVVFKSPHGDDKDYVKRCVGLPGETVLIKGGVVYINNAPIVFAGVPVQRLYEDFGPVTIPENHYFMMGDNRGQSSDSRSWGTVPKSDLLGKAMFTFWPLSRMRVLH